MRPVLQPFLGERHHLRRDLQPAQAAILRHRVDEWCSAVALAVRQPHELVERHGVVRLLGMLGITCRMKVGRTSKSTRDTYWVVVSGADQVERLLDLVNPADREGVLSSLERQARRIAPTGSRRDRGAAWVRVVGSEPLRHQGWVYSVEVPSTETFVTTAGLVVHNCFPKDVQALSKASDEANYDFGILKSVMKVNESQKTKLIAQIKNHFKSIKGKTFAFWGLSFKPHTDDIREAPALYNIEALLALGAIVRAHDPEGMDNTRKILGDRITYHNNPYEAAEGADAIFIATEWPEFRTPDFARLATLMKSKVIFDGRNLYELQDMKDQGFTYISIGRKPIHG